MSCDLVTANHLGRKAVVYIRQSSPHQVLTNREGLRLQYALRQRARELGWREPDIEVIDRDLGRSGAGAEQRTGFKDLIARVTLGEVGLILSADVTRLTRNCSDWYPLLDLCGYRECLIADRDGVVRSRNPEREAPARPQGHDLRDGAAHLAGPADGRPAQQGPARRAGPATAGRPGPRPDRDRGQEPRSRGAGAHRAGLRHLPREAVGGQGAAHPPRRGPGTAPARPARRHHLAAADAVRDLRHPQEPGLPLQLRLHEHELSTPAASLSDGLVRPSPE